jgi:hypothetical protein
LKRPLEDGLKIPDSHVFKIKTRTLIKNLTKETIGNEASQAVIRIFDTKYLGLKLFWLLCLLGSSSLCFYLVAQTFMTYLSYPVYTTTSIVHEVPSLFPKITICNSAFAITEYAYEQVKEINGQVSSSISIFNKSQISNLPYNDAFAILWNMSDIFQTRINSASFSNLERQKLVHALQDVLVNCQYNGETCTVNDFIWKWDPLYGNCYVFNSGYNINGSKVNYKESTLTGTVFGLQLNVYVGYNDKLIPFNNGYFSWVPFSNAYGLYVLIENNTYLGHTKQNVLALNGGSVNFMPIQKRFSSRLPKPYSDCEIDNKNPIHSSSLYYNLILNSRYQYSQELCVIQCVQLQVIQLCNCSFPFYLDLYNKSCENRAESNCAFATVYTRQLNVQKCILECPLECNSTEITFSLTSQTYSGNGFALIVNQTPVFFSDFNTTPITEATASNKFVQLYVYYDSFSFTSSQDSSSMDIVAFLGNIGGTLGLFLGVSLLSMCELIHVVIESCILVRHMLKDRQKTTDLT